RRESPREHRLQPEDQQGVSPGAGSGPRRLASQMAGSVEQTTAVAPAKGDRLMRRRFRTSLIIAALAIPLLGQAQAPRIPRLPDGKPNLTGLWQALGTAYWDISDHIAPAGQLFQLGAVGASPR